MNEHEIEERIRELCAAEGEFCLSESELYLRPIAWGSIAASTAVVFGKLLAWLAAGREYKHADVRQTSKLFLGPEPKGMAAMLIENLHRTIDRGSRVEEEYRLASITSRVLLVELRRRVVLARSRRGETPGEER